VEKPGERAYFVYTKDSSENNQGGLKGRKLKTKQVVHHENSANPSRCPVWLFKLYKILCPQVPKENAFYLQPLKKPKQDCWFSIKPVGHNSLNAMVKEMCKVAGITGFRTNLSVLQQQDCMGQGLMNNSLWSVQDTGAWMESVVTSGPAKSN